MNDFDVIKARYDDAKQVRSQYEGTLAMLGKYNWPQMQDVVVDQKMDDGNVVKTVDVYNSTAALASEVMANGILANMMPIGLQWFEFAPEDNEMAEDYDIRDELSKRSMNTHRALFSSNFLSKMALLFRSMVVYTFGCIGKKKKDNKYHFSFYSLKEFLYEKNSDGLVDTVFRIMTYDARQARQEFGNVDLGDKVKKALGEKSKTKFTFVHAVFPNEDYDGKFGSKKFASKILNIDDGVFVESESYKNGYNALPYKVAFLGESQDGNIGSSPSIDVLPTVKECDAASKTFIESCEINSFPPTMVEDDGVVGQPNIGPRGLIVIRAGAMKPEPFKTGANPQLNAEFIAPARSGGR